MDEKEELELRTEMHRLEFRYKSTRLALILGWIPFILLAPFLLFLSITTRPSVPSVVVHGSNVEVGQSMAPEFFVIAFIALIFGLITFYAFAFRRQMKISAELSVKKARLEIESGKGTE